MAFAIDPIVTLLFVAALFALGAFVGVLSGLFGIGGGLLIVPFLTGLGFGVLPATATSLVGVIFSSMSGSIRNWQAGELDWRRSFGLAIGGIPAAQLGAVAGAHFSTSGLAFSFAALQAASIYLIGLRQRLADGDSSDEGDRADAPTLLLNGPSIAIGAIAGGLAGLFGVGGGVVMVPLQMLILKTPIKDAVRVSLGAIVAIGLSGLARHALLGNVLWIPGLCMGAGGIIGAQLGARLLPYLAQPVVSGLFRVLLAVVAAVMIVEGWIALPSG